MRLFITGASGYIGKRVTKAAIQAGHTVYGLSRSENSDAIIRELGGTPVRGDLYTHDVLREQAKLSDGVIHLAFIHDWSVGFEKILQTETNAIHALAESLVGSNKPLIMTTGTGTVVSDPSGGETDESAAINTSLPISHRAQTENVLFSYTARGVRTVVMRLAPFVYGEGGDGFLCMFARSCAKNKIASYINDGSHCLTDVHVADVAQAYIKALEKAPAGSIYNITGETNVTFKQLLSTLGEMLEIPVESVSPAELVHKWDPIMAMVANLPHRASNAKAKRELGWTVTQRGIIDDLKTGSYVPFLHELKAQIRGERPATGRTTLN